MRVALITVGDEILSGDITNTNAAWLGERLSGRGVDVERTIVLPDREADIARVVNEARAEYDAVIVTGGLGPTHDDVTVAGVAAAFGVPLGENAEAVEWIEANKGYERSDLAEGTTHLPKGARMLPNEVGVAPGAAIGDVYVLPGVPREMRAMFGRIEESFSGTPRHHTFVYAAEPESALLDRIDALREEFDVKVGSYPGESVRIKLESEDEGEIARAAAWLGERVDLAEEE